LTWLRVGLAYIDGDHTFDYTLLDFWYVYKMLEIGGVVGFNDCDYPAVDEVLRFLLLHRKFKQLDVGLPIIYEGPEGGRCTVRA
jgi:hypothetical protein